MIEKTKSIDPYLDQIRLTLENKETDKAVCILVELYPADQLVIYFSLAILILPQL
jgi:hypothetical protein